MKPEQNIKQKKYIRSTKNGIKNIKIALRIQEALIKLFNDHSLIVSETKYKATHRRRISSMLTCIAHLVKVSDHSNLKILSPKQMLQRLPIALAQVKTCNISEYLLNKIR